MWNACKTALFLGSALSMQAQGVSTIHVFTNSPDGVNPLKLVAANGLFYGVTVAGGTNNDGVIFSLNTNGTGLNILYQFSGGASGGMEPNNILVAGGTIYGTAFGGGTNGEGMLYSVSTNGTGFTSLCSFGSINLDGYDPKGGLILSGATLYGTTVLGGTNSWGTVFKINTNGTGYTILRSFTGQPDGGEPQSELLLNGNMLYGTTAFGGTNGFGTVFAVDTNGGSYSDLYSFGGVPDARYPYCGLTLSAGVLFGNTATGGTNTTGAIFAINKDGSNYRQLYSLAADSSDGNTPRAAMTLVGSNLYCTATSGGGNGGGTIFIINTNGTSFDAFVSFTNNGDFGWDPDNGPLRSGNSLWGTTRQGNDSITSGSIYRVFLPALSQPPQSLTITNNNPASFSVVAADDQPIKYQWYFNSAIINNQTNSTLSYAVANTNNGGNYVVVCSDSLGSVTSAPAVLTVVVPNSRPVISQPPQNFTVTNGLTATFTNLANGTGPLYYLWYFNTNTLVAVGTSSILTITPATTNNAGYYTVIVTNSFGSATSSPALLTVIVPATKPVITQQPQNFTVTNGFTATFTNVASGTAPLSYQWYFNTNTPVGGGTNAILTIASAGPGSAGYYNVIVTNIAGSATSSPALLTVVALGTKPSITQQPAAITVTNGYPASFTNVASGTTPLFYQWYFNTNTAVTGGTNAILTIASVTTNNVGYYSVIITNIAGAATSSPAKLTIISTKPIIITQPPSQSVKIGDPVNIPVVAGGQPPLRFFWYTNNITTIHRLSTQTNANVFFASATASMAGNYILVITNSLGAATSSVANLVITAGAAPSITQNPSNAIVINGNPVTFTTAATGDGTLAYQWYFRTNTLLGGATNTSLLFTNVITNLAGFYDVRVTNLFGAATSSYALLTVSNKLNVLSYFFSNDSASFVVANLNKSTNRLWATTNLGVNSAWRAIVTNIMGTNGLWFFTDTNTAKTNSTRLYRFSSP